MSDVRRGTPVRIVQKALMVVVMVLGQSVCTGQAVPAPSGEQILENLERTFAGIEDYTVTLQVTVDLERLKVPEMEATMYFKQPDKVHFETDGFALLPREGMAMALGKMRANYTVESSGEEVIDGATTIVLRLRPRAELSKLRDVRLSVDPVRWVVIRGVVRMPEGREMTASFDYQRVENRWLPSTMTVLFAAAASDTMETDLFEQYSPARRPQLLRTGTVTVQYSDYRLNTGLSDEIFEPPSGESKNGR